MKFSLIFLLFLVSISVRGQNAFPPTGNVSVGTSAPFTQLSVGDSVGIGPTNDALGDMVGKYGLVFQTYGGTYRGAAIVGKQVSTYGVDLLFGTKYLGGNELKERMRITNGGNIGIGTTLPAAILHVKKDYAGISTQLILENENSDSDQGNSVLFKGYYNQAKITSHENPGNYTGGNLQLQTYSDNSTLNAGITITKNGRMGFGTETPSALTHIYQSGSSLDVPTLLIQDFSTNPSRGKDVMKIIGRDNADSSYLFRVIGNNGLIKAFAISDEGHVGVGTESPTEKLSVEGNVSANGYVKAKRVIVTQYGWSDYVFNNDYKLRSLSSLESFIKQNKHLPEVPSAKEVESEGISVGDNQALLLKKIEELTLYVIAQQKQIDQQAKAIKQLRNKNNLK
jgi:hypothetical protein